MREKQHRIPTVEENLFEEERKICVWFKIFK